MRALALGTVFLLNVQTGLSFGYFSWEPEYNIEADINGDDVVDMGDIVIVAIHWGESDF